MEVRERRKRSRTWEHFVPIEDRTAAMCQLCEPPFKVGTSGGATTGLLKHLTLHHPALQRREAPPVNVKKAPPPKPSLPPNITTMEAHRRHIKRREIRSEAWKHFVPSEDRLTARCKLCHKFVNTPGGSTTGLLRHFRSVHEKGEEAVPEDAGRKSKIWQYFTRSEDGMFAECKLCEPGVELKVARGSTSSLLRHYYAYHRRSKLEPLEAEEAETKYDPSTAPQSSMSAKNNPTVEMDLSGLPGPRRRRKKSIMWEHFIPSEDRGSAQCKICDAVVKTSKGATTGMLKHFRCFHSSGATMRRPGPMKRKSMSLIWKNFTRSEDGMTAECKLCEPGVELKVSQDCTSGLLRHYITFHRRPKSASLEAAETKYDPSSPTNSSRFHANGATTKRSGPWKRKSRSLIWKHFTRSEDGMSAKCKLCEPEVELKTKQGNTSSLLQHLQSFHYRSKQELSEGKVGEGEAKETSTSPEPSTINNRTSERMTLSLVRRVIRPGETRRGFRSKVWKHFIRKEGGLAQCKTCNALVKVFGNSTSSLIRHKCRHENGATTGPWKRMPTSMIWAHFTRSEDGVSATCNSCGKELQTSQKGSTTVLIHHFRRYHEAVATFTGPNFEGIGRGKKSKVWEYFIRTEDKLTAHCKSCNAEIPTTKGKTRGLLRHLRSHHQPTSIVSKGKSDVWENFIRSDNKLSGKCKLCGLEIKMPQGCTTGLLRHFRNVHENGGTYLGPNKRRPRSHIWKYFTRNEGGLSAKCQLCDVDIKTSQGSTTQLLRHFRVNHESTLLSRSPSHTFNSNDCDFDDDWEPHQSEPTVLRPSPSCLFCYKSCPEPTPSLNTEMLGAVKCSQLERQLKQVFILKHLVDTPSSWCEEALIKNDGESNPDSWFRICSGCIEVVNEGWEIYQKMLCLESKMKSVKEKIKDAIHRSVSLKSSESGTGIDNEIRKRLSECVSVTASQEYAKAIKVENIDCNTEDIESPPSSPLSLDLNDEPLFSDDSVNNDSDVNFENVRTRKEKPGEKANHYIAEVKSEMLTNKTTFAPTWKQCSLCPTRFKEEHLLASHVDDHEASKKNGGKFDCATCMYPGKDEADLKEHMVSMKHNNPLALFPMKYSCKKCDFVGDDVWKLRNHVRNEHPDLPKEELADQTCSLCRRKFDTFTSLLHHQRRMHPTVFGVEEEIIKCDQCEMVFSSKLHLHYHKLNTHLRVNTSMCDICGKGFTNVHYMERHKRTHGEKYICDICGLDYSSEAVLEKHLKEEHPTSSKEGESNPSEEIYKCKHCDLTSPFRLVIKRHMPIHKKEMGVQCDICHKYYYNEQGLRLHKKINHSETKELFKCPYCCKPFSASHNINGHLKSCHVKRLIDKAKSASSPSPTVEGEPHSNVPIHTINNMCSKQW